MKDFFKNLACLLYLPVAFVVRIVHCCIMTAILAVVGFGLVFICISLAAYVPVVGTPLGFIVLYGGLFFFGKMMRPYTPRR